MVTILEEEKWYYQEEHPQRLLPPQGQVDPQHPQWLIINLLQQVLGAARQPSSYQGRMAWWLLKFWEEYLEEEKFHRLYHLERV